VDRPVDLAVQLGWNVYNDRKLLQMELLDWRTSESEAADRPSVSA
jgi:single-stranded-DNA-specific exonuclease